MLSIKDAPEQPTSVSTLDKSSLARPSTRKTNGQAEGFLQGSPLRAAFVTWQLQLSWTICDTDDLSVRFGFVHFWMRIRSWSNGLFQQINARPNCPQSTMPTTKARCETCNCSFGLIRHRYAYKQFAQVMPRQLPRQHQATGFQFQPMDRLFSRRSLVDQLNSADGSWMASSGANITPESQWNC
jgi:hypothetical protein